MEYMINFEEDVLMRSQEVPVVVDFWAPWCGPCQTLGPIIEALAKEAGGKWELVKVNTDEQQEVSLKYKIRGIPAVKMFYMGEVKAEFTGALPRHQIIKWLDENLPEQDGDPLTQIVDTLFTDRHQQAAQALEQFVGEQPDHEEARLWLAAATVGKHPERAQLSLPENHKLYELSTQIKNLAEVMTCQEAAPPALEEKIKTAQQALQDDRHEEVIQALIAATMMDKNYCDELPRRASVALFLMLGEQHPITKKYRRQFNMALY
ncbi:thioredoxin [Catalinimonas niigatensis]|uniref:thioredoxin n=1 Tax=Catalinimonas niigatensis TaxID=1397264 RepID=UPI0026656FEF|nr:thioredoxin [Catalinimonas niigatensis]WPP49895.1 thioredoxin [Catalinimonas niigatensis]